MKSMKAGQLRTIIFFALLALCLVLFSNFLIADEMVFKQHLTTLPHDKTKQFSRNQAIKDAKQAAIEEAERDADNTTLARFIRNLERVEFMQD